MEPSTLVGLTGLAAFLGFLHTLLGPDHYLPFIAMARIGRWSRSKTIVVTLLCGVGHVLGSILIGAIGIATGVALRRLDVIERIEGARGDMAAWLLLAFGLTYAAWGLRRAARRSPHSHWHAHADATTHAHTHTHEDAHVHPHVHPVADGSVAPWADRAAPWVLFTIFVFGPCEALIPLLMVPAFEQSVWGVALVAAVFALATIVTMLALVLAGCAGLAKLPLGPLERYSHALAGAALSLCGGLMLLGL